MPNQTFNQTNQQVAKQINIAGDLIIKEPFSGIVNRFILAQSLLVNIVISYFRGDPFPYAKSLQLVILCISVSKEGVKDWFNEWSYEVEGLIKNPKTKNDLNRLASELGLITELLRVSQVENGKTTEHIQGLIGYFYKIRNDVIEQLSGELAEKQRKLKIASPRIKKQLEIVLDWIHLLNSYTKGPATFTPVDLELKMSHYIEVNPDSVATLILDILSGFKELLVWVIKDNNGSIVEQNLRLSRELTNQKIQMDETLREKGELEQQVSGLKSNLNNLSEQKDSVEKLNDEIEQLKSKNLTLNNKIKKLQGSIKEKVNPPVLVKNQPMKKKRIKN